MNEIRIISYNDLYTTIVYILISSFTADDDSPFLSSGYLPKQPRIN